MPNFVLFLKNNTDVDSDVVRLMASTLEIPTEKVKSRILSYNYVKDDLATYFLLLKRKQKLGVQLFRYYGIDMKHV